MSNYNNASPVSKLSGKTIAIIGGVAAVVIAVVVGVILWTGPNDTNGDNPGTTNPGTTNPGSNQTSSTWKDSEKTIMVKEEDGLRLVVTIWNGKDISKDVNHPSLGGSKYTISINDYDGQDAVVVVPFLMEATNVSDAPKTVSFGAELGRDMEIYFVKNGTSLEYTHLRPLGAKNYDSFDNVAPNERVAISGYLIVPMGAFHSNSYGAEWNVRGPASMSCNLDIDDNGNITPKYKDNYKP